MTFEDARVVETHVAGLHAGGLPVMLSTEYDRVNVDARKLGSFEAASLADALSRLLGRKGYLWDVWMETDSRIIHVAEREEAS